MSGLKLNCQRCKKPFVSHNVIRHTRFCCSACGYGTPLERFLEKIDKTPNGCWNWIGGRNAKGYGNFGWRNSKIIGAHRASWMLFRGEIPAGQCVLHKCIGNPACVNPEHLYIGDHLRNAQDRMEQGREPNRQGIKHPRCKLSENDVLQIKALGNSVSGVMLAAQYRVCSSAIYKIRNGENWKHLFLSPLCT